jgi:hypothetical protein
MQEFPMSSDSTEHLDDADLAWGASNIARAINVNERKCFYMLESGHLPARKVGGCWVASKRRLLAALSGEANPA